MSRVSYVRLPIEYVLHHSSFIELSMCHFPRITMQLVIQQDKFPPSLQLLQLPLLLLLLLVLMRLGNYCIGNSAASCDTLTVVNRRRLSTSVRWTRVVSSSCLSYRTAWQEAKQAAIASREAEARLLPGQVSSWGGRQRDELFPIALDELPEFSTSSIGQISYDNDAAAAAVVVVVVDDDDDDNDDQISVGSETVRQMAPASRHFGKMSPFLHACVKRTFSKVKR